MRSSRRLKVARSNAVSYSAAVFSATEPNKHRLWLAPKAIGAMVTLSAGAKPNETGGILLGRYDQAGWIVEVTEVTPAPRDSRGGRNWFKRGVGGLGNLLRQKWEMGVHYVGEWHFHPGGAPRPSTADVASLSDIASNPSYQCAAPLLIILGGNPPNAWELSATLFVQGTAVTLNRSP